MVPVSDTNLQPVIDNDLCIGCGACMAADPSLALRLDEVKQIFEPSHASNALAASVCPAIAVDYGALQEARFPGEKPGPFGVVRSVLLAQSVDVDRNLRASSGGIIKELVLALLERDDVDGVISLDHVSGLDFQPKLVTDADEVDSLPGSIYHNLEKHRVLELLQENEGRFVLIGIPCELEGIFSYIYRIEPRLAERVHSTIGLICGWQYSHHALRAICEYKGIDFDHIEGVSYRGGGPVGKLRIETSGGGEHSVNRRIDLSYQTAFDRHFNTPRCHLCVNHANFLADIVVGDAWLPSTVGTRTGISLVIARTAPAEDMVTALAEAGKISLTRVTTNEIMESQTRRIAFGDFAYAFADHLRRIGRFVPDLRGPNYSEHEPVPEAETAHFLEELEVKLRLQRERKYRRLRRRKLTKELPRLAQRYIRWFLVRILRIKSITGKREEIPRENLTDFR